MKELNLKKELYISLIFLIVMLSGNYLVWQVTKSKLLDHSSTLFEEVSEDVVHLAQGKTEKLQDILKHGRQLFEITGSVNRADFQAYYSQVYDDQKDNIPALRRIAYIEKTNDVNAFIARTRSEKSEIPAQFLFFSVSSLTPNRQDHYIYNYTVPYVAGNKIFGTDLASVPGFLEAFKKSAVQDGFSLVGPVNIQGENLLFLIYPVYDGKSGQINRSEKGVKGYITAVLEPEHLLEGVFEYQEILKNLNIRLYLDVAKDDDLKQKEPIYEDINDSKVIESSRSETLSARKHFHIADRQLALVIESQRTMQLTLFERYFPDIVFFGGGIMIISFFIIMVSFKLKCEEESRPD